MILNHYENTTIRNQKLPESWRTQDDLNELESFLQQNWEQRFVFFNDGEISSKQQFIAFTGQQSIKTKNYIGTIVFKGEQLNIFPKVFKMNADDYDTGDLSLKHLMNNLVQWIGYCNKFEYPFINISSELSDAEDLKELFITLYIGYVRLAIDRGLFYQYVEETEDCTSIKGKFNVKDYIVNKIPNGQSNKFLCSYSKFEFDNMVNRIIKCTCKMLLNITSSKNRKALRNILVRLNDVSDVSCNPSDCNIRLSKMNYNYDVIISMSKMFLLNKTSTYSVDVNKSFCFLFPAELLFEGFVGGFMKEVVQENSGKVRLQQSEMSLIDDVIYGNKSLGTAFTMRHDILVEYGGNVFILDTKYKEISRFEGNEDEVKGVVAEEPKQSDIYQVCEYARKRHIKDVFLLYPMFRYEENEPIFPVGISKGEGEDIYIHFIRVPFVFEDDETIIKNRLKEVIKSILGIN